MFSGELCKSVVHTGTCMLKYLLSHSDKHCVCVIVSQKLQLSQVKFLGETFYHYYLKFYVNLWACVFSVVQTAKPFITNYNFVAEFPNADWLAATLLGSLRMLQ